MTVEGSKEINLQAINKTFRNYLIIVIISRVGHRAGIPVNLTIEIFEKAKLKGNRYILKIYNYKTMTRDNKRVVNFILAPKLYFHLKFYIDQIPNPIMEKKSANHKYVFVSSSGKRLPVGAVSTSVKSEAGLLGLDARKLKPNMILKSVTSFAAKGKKR